MCPSHKNTRSFITRIRVRPNYFRAKRNKKRIHKRERDRNASDNNDGKNVDSSFSLSYGLSVEYAGLVWPSWPLNNRQNGIERSVVAVRRIGPPKKGKTSAEWIKTSRIWHVCVCALCGSGYVRRTLWMAIDAINGYFECEAGTGMRHQHNGKANENRTLSSANAILALAFCGFGIEVFGGLTSLLLCWTRNKIRHPIIIIVSAPIFGAFSPLFQHSCCRLPRISLPLNESPQFVPLITLRLNFQIQRIKWPLAAYIVDHHSWATAAVPSMPGKCRSGKYFWLVARPIRVDCNANHIKFIIMYSKRRAHVESVAQLMKSIRIEVTADACVLFRARPFPTVCMHCALSRHIL